MFSRRPWSSLLVAAVLLAGLSAACGSSGGGSTGPVPSNTASAFPMTIQNCGHTFTLARRPTRILTISDDATNNVAAAGGLNLIVATAVTSADPVFTDTTTARMKTVPVLETGSDTLSKEPLLAAKPDLVIGENDQGVSVEDLAAFHIPFLVTSGYCQTPGPGADGDGKSDFTDIENDIMLYGKILGTESQAADAVNGIKSRIDQITSKIKPVATKPTAAALYLSGKTLAGYGNKSMSHTQFGILGLTNVFADTNERYFEPNLEEIVKRNPEYLEVVTYPSPTRPPPTLDDLKAFPGMDTVTAVKNGHVLIQPYSYSSQAPFSVDGLERLASAFGLT